MAKNNIAILSALLMYILMFMLVPI